MIGKKKNRAFTLIEMIIALGIFSVGILTILNLLINNLYFLDKASTRTQASFLAKEGIELVYNLRDSNMLKAYPRNCIPSDNITTLEETSLSNTTDAELINNNQIKKICKSVLGEKSSTSENGAYGAFSITFSPKEYVSMSEIQELDKSWEERFEKYKLIQQKNAHPQYQYYTNNIPLEIHKQKNKDEQQFSKFARYIVAKPLVEKKSETSKEIQEISTRNIVKLESHVLYKNGTRTGEVIFESFIGSY